MWKRVVYLMSSLVSFIILVLCPSSFESCALHHSVLLPEVQLCIKTLTEAHSFLAHPLSSVCNWNCVPARRGSHRVAYQWCVRPLICALTTFSSQMSLRHNHLRFHQQSELKQKCAPALFKPRTRCRGVTINLSSQLCSTCSLMRYCTQQQWKKQAALHHLSLQLSSTCSQMRYCTQQLLCTTPLGLSASISIDPWDLFQSSIYQWEISDIFNLFTMGSISIYNLTSVCPRTRSCAQTDWGNMHDVCIAPAVSLVWCAVERMMSALVLGIVVPLHLNFATTHQIASHLATCLIYHNCCVLAGRACCVLGWAPASSISHQASHRPPQAHPGQHTGLNSI